jgi:hypothetical protein
MIICASANIHRQTFLDKIALKLNAELFKIKIKLTKCLYFSTTASVLGYLHFFTRCSEYQSNKKVGF